MAEIIPSSVRSALEQALRGPTRTLIFTELLLSEELSASMLAERLTLDLNTVAHHVRSLASAGLIELVREVRYRGGVTQKFYRVTRSLALSLQARPQVVASVASQATTDERFGLYLAYLLLAANVLARAPAHYSTFDTQLVDSLFLHQPLGTVAFGGLPRPALAELAQLVRNLLDREWAKDSQQPHRDFVVFAALPEFLPAEQQR